MLPRADWGRRCRRGRDRALALLPPVLSRGPPERRGGPLRSGRLLEEHQSTGVHSPRTGKTIGAGPFPEASTRPPGKALSHEDGSLLADHEYGAGATTDEAIEDALRRVAERHGINLEASLLTWDD